MAHRHLKKHKLEPILYMTEWFMCAFSRTLPWASVLRVWDMFLCEGEATPTHTHTHTHPIHPHVSHPSGCFGRLGTPVRSPTSDGGDLILTPPGVKIIFRVGLVLLKCMLGSQEKLKACQGLYETMELLRAIEARYMQESFLDRKSVV